MKAEIITAIKPIHAHAKKVLGFSFVRYLIIGTLSVVIDFGIFNALIIFAGFNPLPANMISLSVSMVFNFRFSNSWTFQSKTRGRKKITKYLIISAFNYVVNNTILYIMVTHFSINSAVAKIAVTILQISWTFIIYKIWVFKEPEDIPGIA